MGHDQQNELFSLLFASGMPLTEEDLVRYTSVRKNTVTEELAKLSERLEAWPIQLMQERNGRWKLTLKQDYVSVVRHLNAETELAKTALEILALVAHKEPALQSEIVEQIGSHAYEHIRELVKEGFLEKTPSGRSFKLSLSDTFFRYFEIGREQAKDLFHQ
ncbi:MAG: SMC-Scp complex subunit ScpB [Candidatus Woesearchaeota archaeon]